MSIEDEQDMWDAIVANDKPKPFIVAHGGVQCIACRDADTIDSRIILDGETPEDAYAAHCRSVYHADTMRSL